MSLLSEIFTEWSWVFIMRFRGAGSFLQGAIILSLATLITRLLGAFYKPIIARIFSPFDGYDGAAGIGLTQIPLTAYMVILSFTSVGLNVGISRLVSERMALGDTVGAKKVFNVSLVTMSVLGLISSVLFWIGSPWIASLISNDASDVIPGFKATAPALVVSSMLASYRGLFQGLQYMGPSAYSQIIEQIVRVISGAFLTFIYVRISVPMGAAAFNFGDALGALAALLYLVILYRNRHTTIWNYQEGHTFLNSSMDNGAEKPWTLIGKIFTIATPIMVIGAVVPLMMTTDTLFLFRALEEWGMASKEINAQYGILTNVFMLVNLPAIFTTAIYTSILPSITHAITRSDIDDVRAKIKQGYRTTMILAIPSQIGLLILSNEIYSLFYGNIEGGRAMMSISWATSAIMIQQTTSGVLQGIGKVGIPVTNFIVGACFKVILTLFWTKKWGIYGAAYATVVGFWIAAVLNIVFIEKKIGPIFSVKSMLLKPLVAGILMAGAIVLLGAIDLPVNTSSFLKTLGIIFIGSFSYGLIVVTMGVVTRQEIELIPRVGMRIANFLVRIGLVR